MIPSNIHDIRLFSLADLASDILIDRYFAPKVAAIVPLLSGQSLLHLNRIPRIECDVIWRIQYMSKMSYRVVKHDGGWAYDANGTFSEPFPTRDAARKAAKLAASEQAAPSETTQISYEDEKGHWHEEVDSGTDRPKTTVEG
jgi:hypothetical protein